MPASLAEVLGGLLLLAVGMVPTGLALLRVLERLLGHRFPLTAGERTLLALYATGFLLFFIASLPLPLYTADTVVGVMVLGTAAYAYLLLRSGSSELRALATRVRDPTRLVVALGMLGLLIFELVPIWDHPFSNAWDGSATALWANLIVSQHTVPATLQPFANAPVIYPLGTAVWMTLPALLFEWPLVQVPVLLPPLFLSLTVPASYAWGARWFRSGRSDGRAAGLVFAAFFGLVAGIPRFYTGGWYDFELAFPLLILAVGFLPQWGSGTPPRWRVVVAGGLAAGVLTTLSVAAGEVLVVLLLAFALLAPHSGGRSLARQLSQVGLFVLFEAAFTLRSVVAWAGSLGSTYAPTAYYGPLTFRLAQGELNPFVPWKAKLSPLLLLSVEIQFLLAAGLVLAIVWCLVRERFGVAWATALRSMLICTGTTFAMTAVLLLTTLPGQLGSRLRAVTNLDQASVVLFLFFEGLAALPLVWLTLPHPTDANPRELASSAEGRPEPGPGPDPRPRRARRDRPRYVTVGVVVALLLPLALGGVTTVLSGPGYIQSNVGKTSDVTAGDVDALEWAGSHLPSCSVVLVAPGSAAQFLPEYATLRVAFPMNPVPTNGSYGVAVANLTEGVYTAETRSALLSLGTSEVFVTGPTSVSFAPFLSQPMANSSDFSKLYASGDAMIFAFLPVLSTSGCPPG